MTSISYALNNLTRFTLHARNTASGDKRDLSVYARDETAAYASGFSRLDAESGDRTWCFDSFTKET